MTKRKPLFKKGDKVVVEDNSQVFTVISDPLPAKASAIAKRNDTYEYRVQSKRDKWYVCETDMTLVTFQPINYSPARHFELADSLPVYEVMRKYLESLPANTTMDGCRVVEALKQLVEQTALSIEGDTNETFESRREIESLMR